MPGRPQARLPHRCASVPCVHRPCRLATPADGDAYTGMWRGDKRHGKGKVTYRGPDGSVVESFEGDWVEGRMEGFGKYTYADGGA